jgi:hypothetical protein
MRKSKTYTCQISGQKRKQNSFSWKNGAFGIFSNRFYHATNNTSPFFKWLLIGNWIAFSVRVSRQVNSTDNWIAIFIKTILTNAMCPNTKRFIFILTCALQIYTSRRKGFNWKDFSLQKCDCILHAQFFHLPVVDLTREKAK